MDPLPVGVWYEGRRSHRFVRLLVGTAAVALVAAAGVKGYEYYSDDAVDWFSPAPVPSLTPPDATGSRTVPTLLE